MKKLRSTQGHFQNPNFQTPFHHYALLSQTPVIFSRHQQHTTTIITSKILVQCFSKDFYFFLFQLSKWVVVKPCYDTLYSLLTLSFSWRVWPSSLSELTFKSRWKPTWNSLIIPISVLQLSWLFLVPLSWWWPFLDVAELALKILVWCTLTVPYLLWSWLPWLVSLWPLLSSRLVSYK